MKRALWIAVWIVCLLVNTLSLHALDGFLIVTGFCALLFLFLFALSKKRQKVKVLVKTTLFCLTALVASIIVHSTLEDNSKKRGIAIIQALSDYKKTYGELPESLDNLVPAYLPEIPQTMMRIMGTKYFYAKQGKEYLLGFSTASLTGYVYDSREGTWQHRD